MIFENNDPNVAVPHKDLTSVVLQRANELGEKPALIDGVSGRTLSYIELKKQINHLASGLHQRGYRQAHHICFLNKIQFQSWNLTSHHRISTV